MPRIFANRQQHLIKKAEPKVDRSAVKANVQSLYPTAWETVYEATKPAEAEYIMAKEPLESSLTMESVRLFLESRCHGSVASFGDDLNGMLIVEIEAARGRLSIADELIRKVHADRMMIYINLS